MLVYRTKGKRKREIKCRDHEGCPIHDGNPPTVETCAKYLVLPNWPYAAIGKKNSMDRDGVSDKDIVRMAELFLNDMLEDEDG